MVAGVQFHQEHKLKTKNEREISHLENVKLWREQHMKIVINFAFKILWRILYEYDLVSLVSRSCKISSGTVAPKSRVAVI